MVLVSEAALIIEDLHVFIKKAHILQGVSLAIGDAPVAIVGRNGMGKTTLCDTLFAFRQAQQGRMTYLGKELRGLRAHEVSKLGLAYVPQGRRLFPHLTVREHLRLAFRASHAKQNGLTIRDVTDLFPKLSTLENHRARSLSGGEQQMLAIGRALLTQPSLLVLDEPSEGLAPVIIESLVEALRRLSNAGTRLLLVEQNLRVAAGVATKLAVMVNGRIVENVNSSDFLRDIRSQERLLGLQV